MKLLQYGLVFIEQFSIYTSKNSHNYQIRKSIFNGKGHVLTKTNTIQLKKRGTKEVSLSPPEYKNDQREHFHYGRTYFFPSWSTGSAPTTIPRKYIPELKATFIMENLRWCATTKGYHYYKNISISTYQFNQHIAHENGENPWFLYIFQHHKGILLETILDSITVWSPVLISSNFIKIYRKGSSEFIAGVYQFICGTVIASDHVSFPGVE